MARTHGYEKQHVYQAAERFVEAALKADDSLFTPGQPIWALPQIDEFYERFVVHRDESSDSFMNKLKRQLSGAQPQTIQFVAEILYVHFLVPIDIGGSKKRQDIQAVLSWAPAPSTIPAELDHALGEGIAKTGITYKTNRDQRIRFLLEFIRAWKGLPLRERAQKLNDPWAFHDMLSSLPHYSAYLQREALLHLVFPDTFENIVSREYKAQIVAAFKDLTTENLDDYNRALFQIRQELQRTYGTDFSFYDEPLLQRWQSSSDAKNSDAAVYLRGRREVQVGRG